MGTSDYTTTTQVVPDRLVRLPELIALIGVSPSTIWRWERQGEFPTRIHIGARAIGWRQYCRSKMSCRAHKIRPRIGRNRIWSRASGTKTRAHAEP